MKGQKNIIQFLISYDDIYTIILKWWYYKAVGYFTDCQVVKGLQVVKCLGEVSTVTQGLSK